jgi:hypothetical protein
MISMEEVASRARCPSVASIVCWESAGRLIVQVAPVSVLQRAHAERRLHDPLLGLQFDAEPAESVSKSTVTSMAAMFATSADSAIRKSAKECQRMVPATEELIVRTIIQERAAVVTHLRIMFFDLLEAETQA